MLEMDNKEIDIDKFFALSVELTGYNDLSSVVSLSNLEILVQIAESNKNGNTDLSYLNFVRMMHSYKAGAANNLYQDSEFVPILKEILILWYTGFPSSGRNVKGLNFSTASYYEALLWRAIRAHPPGVPGEYFGHWHYLPEH